jgi:hemerythrin-like domain-containing protein
MQPHTKFDFASDLLVVHKVITRALDVAAESGPAAFDARITDPAKFDGYIQYVDCTMRQLHEHHGNEDTVAFPMLRRIDPQEPYDLLVSQHAAMIQTIEHIEGLIADIKGKTPSVDMQEHLLSYLKQLRTSWQTHISEEEAHFGPDGISPSISMADRVKIGKASVRYGSLHSSPLALMLPFALFNLEEDDRATMANMMPGIVTKFLIPVLWRSKWAPMRLYLLVE